MLTNLLTILILLFGPQPDPLPQPLSAMMHGGYENYAELVITFDMPLEDCPALHDQSNWTICSEMGTEAVAIEVITAGNEVRIPVHMGGECAGDARHVTYSAINPDLFGAAGHVEVAAFSIEFSPPE